VKVSQIPEIARQIGLIRAVQTRLASLVVDSQQELQSRKLSTAVRLHQQGSAVSQMQVLEGELPCDVQHIPTYWFYYS
jgi:hypothetical protein